jgi:hypothetical protein
VEEPIYRRTGPDRSTEVLPGGETIEIDGSTVTDPETGQPAPAAVLRLPVWRLRELAATLDTWTQTLTLVTTRAAHLPTEDALSLALNNAAHTLTHPQPH